MPFRAQQPWSSPFNKTRHHIVQGGRSRPWRFCRADKVYGEDSEESTGCGVLHIAVRRRLHEKKVPWRSRKCISSKFVKCYACNVSLMILLLGGDRFCPHNAGAAATSSCQSSYSEHRR